MPVLKRPEICEVTGFSSWTAVQVWLMDVVGPAFQALIRGYLRQHEQRGQKTTHCVDGVKEYFVRNSRALETIVARRVTRIRTSGPHYEPTRRQQPWNNIIAHYEEFIIEALALDRVSLRESENPNTHHIASEGWSHDPDMLFANMYELTESICYNYWKPQETEMWDSDDSDVPFGDLDDVPL